MTSFERKVGLNWQQVGVYCTIIGLLLTISVGGYRAIISLTTSYNKIENNQEIMSNEIVVISETGKENIVKIDSIFSKLKDINTQIKYIKITKQNKPVLIPSEYENLGSKSDTSKINIF